MIVAAEPITDVDTTAAAMLDGLAEELAQAGITLAFAELKDPVRDRLRRYGVLERIPMATSTRPSARPSAHMSGPRASRRPTGRRSSRVDVQPATEPPEPP